ncbi:hypothetical protein CPB85DRAFT_290638 [Mucidula mucida]|nr:hypothetical protein CPB85DRAFT_290638 [Mucidula mucida]
MTAASTSSPVIGIAIHTLNATDNTECRWSLLLAKGSFDAPDVQTYSVTRDRSAWRSDHRVAPLSNSPTLRGVLQVRLSPELPLRFNELKDFIQQFPASADGYNTRSRGWSGTMYTHRILDSLFEAGCIELPCPIEDLMSRVDLRVTYLRRSSGVVPVLPL